MEDFLAPLFAFGGKALLRITPLDGFAELVSTSLGMDPVTIRFAIALYLAYPMAAVNAALPPAARDLWTAVGGLASAMFVFREKWVLLAIVPLVCYLVLAGTGGVRALDHVRHWVCALFAFACLTAAHLTRSGTSATSIDAAALQMVLTCKLYALAYNVFDGTVDAGRLRAKIADAKTSPSERRMCEDRLARSVPRLPSPLEFAGYALNFTTALVGPSFEVGEYLAAQRRPSPPAGAPSRLASAGRKFALGTGLLAAFVLGSAGYTPEGFYALSVEPTATRAPLLWRLTYGSFALLLLRLSYYAVWKIAEGSAVLAGFGYRPPRGDAPADWDGVSNVDPLAVETTVGMGFVMRDWNMQTQSWLERYIFRRSPRSISRWLTFAASAFWHGFYGGYYLSFFTLSVLQECLKYAAGVFKPLLTSLGCFDMASPAGRAFYLWRWGGTIMLLNYALSPFALLEPAKGLAVWASLGYAGHIVPVAIALLAMLARPFLPREPKEALAKPAAVATGGRHAAANGLAGSVPPSPSNWASGDSTPKAAPAHEEAKSETATRRSARKQA